MKIFPAILVYTWNIDIEGAFMPTVYMQETTSGSLFNFFLLFLKI